MFKDLHLNIVIFQISRTPHKVFFVFYPVSDTHFDAQVLFILLSGYDKGLTNCWNWD